ncbi:MAG TPA: baseplate J/gp47 family protein, partial [Sphingomicrobium sp.]|nr:baseplate J/gp47 family protein [Sphingomicrobium sp.]
RALLDRKAQRSREAADWQAINKIVESAGKSKRGDPGWTLQTSKPTDLYGNLALALDGVPDLGGLTEVEKIDDLALHLDRDDVRAAIKTKLFMDVDRQFAPMMALKRAIDSDWAVINGYLEMAGRRKRPTKPDWILEIADQAAFPENLAAAIGQVDYAKAGPEGEGVGDPDSYLARLEEIEGWFFLSAEDVVRLIATYGADDATPAGARAWRDAHSLLAGAHGRKVRAQEAEEMRKVRLDPPDGKAGATAALEAALGDLPPGLDNQMEALARYVPADDVEFVRALVASEARRIPQSSWERADSILADARRRRLSLPEPVAQKEHWRALWAYDDARAARVGDEAQAWRCFGGVPADAGPGHAPAMIGWAIASPVLALTSGRRQISLTLGFYDDDGGALVAPVDDHGNSPRKLPFAVSLSGEKGWIEPTATSFAEVDYARVPGVEPVDPATPLIALQVTLAIDETAAAVEPSLATASFGGTPWPVLRLMLRPVWDEEQGRFDTAYERFRELRLARVHIAAAVGKFVAKEAPGLWPLVVETEGGPADGKKPFEPFGPVPSRGSELAFGHRDLLHKRLTDISLWFEWLGGPDKLKDYYQHYDDRSFTVQLSLVDGGVRTTALGKEQLLFAKDDARVPVRIELPTGDAARPDPVVEPPDDDVRGWRRYLTLRLTGTDFGHQAYPALVSGKAIALANELRNPNGTVTAAKYAVNPPYTPKLKRIGLDFAAAHEIDVGRYAPSGSIDRLFHIHPFGAEEFAATDQMGSTLLPAYNEEGALYVGLAGVEAPQSLSLLFAGVEGGRGHGRPGRLRWSYLDTGGWVEFAEPPEDDTLGLARRGIVRFALPRAQAGTRMPAGLYWLRAVMPDGAANACDLIDVHAQAGSAHYVDEGGDSRHYLQPLPAETIRGLGDPAPGIARVVQPYDTCSGRPAEFEDEFRTRSAERLRHKGRALTLWDYERLVLERFAQVHKVKCLPASVYDDHPGMVRLVIIPDLRGEYQANAFAPRASARLLDEIAAYLGPLAPPTAKIEVGHARFIQVRVRVGVRFRSGADEDFDKRRLAMALNRYLAPWAFDEGSDIAIGQRIDATSIVAFIDRLPFVDFVGVCRLFVSHDDGATFQPGDEGGELVEARGEDGVLTPAQRHEIDIIADDLFEQTEFTGVGYMKVELDFTVQ